MIHVKVPRKTIHVGGDFDGNAIHVNGEIFTPSRDILEDLDYVDERVIHFKQLTDYMISLYSKKNRDYDDAFHKSLDEDGILVAKIRLGDKLRRFTSLIKREEQLVEDETLEDTLLDLASYAIMAVMWKQIQDQKEDK